jgi:hypothetical protein
VLFVRAWLAPSGNIACDVASAISIAWRRRLIGGVAAAGGIGGGWRKSKVAYLRRSAAGMAANGVSSDVVWKVISGEHRRHSGGSNARAFFAPHAHTLRTLLRHAAAAHCTALHAMARASAYQRRAFAHAVLRTPLHAHRDDGERLAYRGISGVIEKQQHGDNGGSVIGVAASVSGISDIGIIVAFSFTRRGRSARAPWRHGGGANQ